MIARQLQENELEILELLQARITAIHKKVLAFDPVIHEQELTEDEASEINKKIAAFLAEMGVLFELMRVIRDPVLKEEYLT